METAQDIIVRGYKEGDEEHIIKLFNLIFNKKRTLEEWQWIFRRNPASNFVSIRVALHNKKIIAAHSYIPFKIKYFEREYIGYQAVDSMVHPCYRGTGIILNKITTQKTSDMPFSFGFPTNTHIRLLGLPVDKHIARYLKPLSTGAFLYILPKELLNMALVSIPIRALIKFVILATRAKNGNFNIIEVASFGNDIDLLWQSIKKDYKICIMRTSQYLNWRYVQANKIYKNQYRLFIIKKGQDTLGYAVLKCRGKRGIIVDFLSIRDKKTIKTFLSFITDYFKDKRMNIVLLHTTADYLKNNLLTSGFFKIKKSPYCLSARSYDESISSDMILDVENWNLTYGDIAEF